MTWQVRVAFRNGNMQVTLDRCRADTPLEAVLFMLERWSDYGARPPWLLFPLVVSVQRLIP